MILRRLFHRHSWRPMKVMYRYKEGGSWGPEIAVKKCQCQVCGKIRYVHFRGKTVVQQ